MTMHRYPKVIFLSQFILMKYRTNVKNQLQNIFKDRKKNSPTDQNPIRNSVKITKTPSYIGFKKTVCFQIWNKAFKV